MFLRNTSDKTGKEPKELFNIVQVLLVLLKLPPWVYVFLVIRVIALTLILNGDQFLTLDEQGKGEITEDETLSTLFARYGPDRIEELMDTLFGSVLKSKGGTGILTFAEYIKRIGIRGPAARVAGGEANM